MLFRFFHSQGSGSCFLMAILALLTIAIAGDKSPLRRNDSLHCDQSLSMRRHRHFAVFACLGPRDHQAQSWSANLTLPHSPRVETPKSTASEFYASRIHQNYPKWNGAGGGGDKPILASSAVGSSILNVHSVPDSSSQEKMRTVTKMHHIWSTGISHVALLGTITGLVTRFSQREASLFCQCEEKIKPWNARRVLWEWICASVCANQR